MECPEEQDTKQSWIIARPRFDEATQYSHVFCQELIDLLKKAGANFFDCSGPEATRQAVTELLKAMPQVDLIFYDHGDEQGLVAQGGEDYIIDKSNDELLIGRIVYTLACLWVKTVDGKPNATAPEPFTATLKLLVL